MNYGDFKALVKGFIPLDTIRSNSGPFIDLLIKSAALDLVYFVPSYDSPTEQRLVAADGLTVGNSMLFTLPSGVELQEAYVALQYDADAVVPGDTEDNAARDYDHTPISLVSGWINRFKVIAGFKCFTGVYDPPTNRLYVSPILEDERALVVKYRVRATNWVDGDETPFSHEDAECVSHYVAAAIARHIEKNPKLAQEETLIHKTMRRLRYMELKDSPAAARVYTPSGGVGSNPVALDSLVELRAVVTSSGALLVGTVLIVITSGFATLWRLTSGAGVDDDDLIVVPDDYSVTVPLHWARVTAAITP